MRASVVAILIQIDRVADFPDAAAPRYAQRTYPRRSIFG
jgi:hypothetical protein